MDIFKIKVKSLWIGIKPERGNRTLWEALRRKEEGLSQWKEGVGRKKESINFQLNE